MQGLGVAHHVLRGGCTPTLRAACGGAAEPPCLRELEKIQIQEASKMKPGELGLRGPCSPVGQGRDRELCGGLFLRCTCFGGGHHFPAGTFIPSCDEDGYYRRAQCEPGGGECWCVDQHGAELTGTRGHGSPDCGERRGAAGGRPPPGERAAAPGTGPEPLPLAPAEEAAGFSGDFGSSVGWEDEEEKEPEEAGEEGEEEEGEAGEGDDGGYIW